MSAESPANVEKYKKLKKIGKVFAEFYYLSKTQDGNYHESRLKRSPVKN